MSSKVFLRASVQPRYSNGQAVVCTWSGAKKKLINSPPIRLLDLCVADPTYRDTLKPSDREELDFFLSRHLMMAKELLVSKSNPSFLADLFGFTRSIKLPHGPRFDESLLPDAALIYNWAVLVDINFLETKITFVNLPNPGERGCVNHEIGLPVYSSIAGISSSQIRRIYYNPGQASPIVRDSGGGWPDIYADRRHGKAFGIGCVRCDLVQLDQNGVWKGDFIRNVSLEQIIAIARSQNPQAVREVLSALNSEMQKAIANLNDADLAPIPSQAQSLLLQE